MTSATAVLTPVVKIDGEPVGDGKPGPLAAIARRLSDAAAVRCGFERSRRPQLRRALARPRPRRSTPAARHPVRLGQHAGRHLADHPRVLNLPDARPWTAAVDAGRHASAQVRLACAKPFRCFRRALGGGERHLPRTLSRDPSRPADPAARARGIAADAGGAGLLSRGRQQQDRRLSAARSRASRLGAVSSARVGAGDAPRTSRPPIRSSWRWTARELPPITRYGWWATPRPT